MRKSIFAFLALAASLFGAVPAQAEVTFEIAVSVNSLAPDARTIGVECQICTTDCERASPAQVVGRGNVQQSFGTGSPHTFSGKVNVVVRPARPADEARATDYLCVLQLANTANASNSMVLAGVNAGPAWTQPQPGTRFVNKLHGKLAKSGATTQQQLPSGTRPPLQKCQSFQVGTWPNCHCPTGLTGPNCNNVDVR